MFSPGDEVVCVDAGCFGAFITTGQHYIVRAAYSRLGEDWLALVGVLDNSTMPGFAQRRFRKLKPDAISIFREMCTAISSGRTLVRVGE